MHEQEFTANGGEMSCTGKKNAQLDEYTVSLPLKVITTDVGLGLDESTLTWVKDAEGKRYALNGIEPVLFYIDLFEGRDYMSLLGGAALHYGLSAYALFGREMSKEDAQ